MSDLEERALRAAQQEQAESKRKQAAAQQAKAQADKQLRARMVAAACSRVESVLGVSPNQANWELVWAWTRQGYGDEQYPLVVSKINGVHVSCQENGDCSLTASADGESHGYEFSLAGFGQALQFLKAKTKVECRYCGDFVKGEQLAAHEPDCYKGLPWHKKIRFR